MALSNAGRNLLAAAAVGSSYTPLDSTHAYIGVGDSTTAFDPTHTDLQASSNKIRKGMDATYPTLSTNVMVFESTYTTSEANFAWQEWATFNASSSGTMFNRKVESLGTKTSAQSWVLTVTLTLTNP
jgi:hypothetical protein